MSTEEFHSIIIPWKNEDGLVKQEEVVFKTSLKGHEIFKILRIGKLGIDGQAGDLSALLTTLTQMAISKAPFDHNDVDNLLALDGKILFKIIGGALKAIPLEEYFQDLGLDSSLLKQD